MSIVCKNLTKYYGQQAALSDVSLNICDNCITALVGPNGAGKSTLIKLITGLIHPTCGYVTIDGYDVHTRHHQALQHLGAIVEWPSFYADLTARRNLEILSGGHGQAYEKKLSEVTDFLKIGNILDRKAGVLSTGQKQRLGIALALLPDSRCIILDEPTNGLDPSGIVEIRELISDYNRQFGVTVLISSHLLSEVEMICDNIIMIVDGKLKACGNLHELLGRKHSLRIVTGNMEETMEFLRRAFEQHAPWIASLPYFENGAINMEMPPGVEPYQVSDELFKACQHLQHFSCEQQKLEDFFLNNAGGKI